MKRLTFLLILYCTVEAVHAQSGDSLILNLEKAHQEATGESPSFASKDPATLTPTSEYSKETIRIRKFDEKKRREFTDSHDYTDSRTKKTERQETPGNPGKSGPLDGERTAGDERDGTQYDYDEEEGTNIDLSWLGPIGTIIFYAALITIIAVIFWQLLRNTSFKTNPKRPAPIASGAEHIHDITELDTDNLIAKAHGARDYKLAIRLYFLDLLKKLNEHGIIIWTKDKTNRDYLSELFVKQYHFDDVRRLTNAYERIWYGEHTPTEERYLALRNEFIDINSKFNRS